VKRPLEWLTVGCLILTAPRGVSQIHVWEKQQLTFQAKKQYENPYTQVEVWVDLKGPGFERRCFGFWDGGDTFQVRVLATAPGRWTWKSGSNQADIGLTDHAGEFVAEQWSDAEKTRQAGPKQTIASFAPAFTGVFFPADLLGTFTVRKGSGALISSLVPTHLCGRHFFGTQPT
jgi:uncharacterized protein DUF5060